MKVGNALIAPQEQLSPDHRANAAQDDLELVNAQHRGPAWSSILLPRIMLPKGSAVKKSGVVTSHVRHRVGDSGALGCASLPLQPQSGGLTPDFLTLSNS